MDEIIRNAQLDVAEELRKQQLEVERVDTALSFLEELELNELQQDFLSDEQYGFRVLREVHEEFDRYTSLVQHFVKAEGSRSNCSKHKCVSDNCVEKARDECNISTGFGSRNTSTFGLDQHLTNSRVNHLAIAPTTTIHISPELEDAVPVSDFDNSHIKSKEILIDDDQSLQNQRIRSASDPGSSVQVIQPSVAANQKSHPFLSQAGFESHSLHAAIQNVLGSLKRTLPGFHPLASNILNSHTVDFISAFATGLRHYDDRLDSQVKVLSKKHDSSRSSVKRNELACEIDHLLRIRRSALTKSEQLLEICRGPYYQSTNCPPLRQMKILHSIFTSVPL